MGDQHQDNSKPKKLSANNKAIISPDETQMKVPITIDRKTCRTKVNNTMKKRVPTIETAYSYNHDHQCNEQKN